MNFSNDLNKNQFQAVTTNSQYVRVVAGAGSGKTRVLTYRIAYLLSELKVWPSKILAITFTNKVAKEMKDRVVKLVPECGNDLLIKTFHSFAAYFLRLEIDAINFPRSFVILDEEDQLKLIKDIGAELGYKKSDKIIKQAINYISSHKLKEESPDDIDIPFEKFEGEKDCKEIYTRYEEQKDKMFALDFDDLLLKTNQILTNFPNIRNKWQRKIGYILVDEFQDSNDVEFRLLRLLTSPQTFLYVVGDPDQTIYTWRGANQDIIMKLEKSFPDIETIVLDCNYRSTQKILNSANKLISYNKFRIPKNLYSIKEEGDEVISRVNASTQSEADYVAREIERLHSVMNYRYNDICILYRSSYITQEFESALTAKRIPYRIFGGLKFYQRREIKDVLSFFRLVVNSKDDISFERIINIPRRGVGETSINQIRFEASSKGLSLYEYLRCIDPKESNVSSKVINSLKTLIINIDHTRDLIEANEEVYSKTLDDLLTSIGYYESLMHEEDGDERLENVRQLFADLRHYLTAEPDSTFDEYLQNIALISSQDELVDGDFVNLMTVHTAKGLEFPVVFIVRFNDTVFPHAKSMNESGFKGLEEERRLAYVAMTRAQDKLYLSCSQGYSYVAGGQLIPSQFYKESGNAVALPREETNPYQGAKSRKVYSFIDDLPKSSSTEFMDNYVPKDDFKPKEETNGITSWLVGDICIHKTFGEGVVIEVDGDGIIKVNFAEHGVKSLLGNHKSLTKGGFKA